MRDLWWDTILSRNHGHLKKEIIGGGYWLVPEVCGPAGDEPRSEQAQGLSLYAKTFIIRIIIKMSIITYDWLVSKTNSIEL